MRYPKRGKGNRWTVKELEAVTADWNGEELSDGGGLSGEVRAPGGTVLIAFRYAYKWEGKTKRFYCGAWPSVSLEQIRTERDWARESIRAGVNPVDRKQADKIEAQREVQRTIAEDRREKATNLTFADMYKAWLQDGVRRADGNAEIQRAFAKDVLPSIGTAYVREIREAHLIAILREMVARDVHRMATRVYDDLVQLFAWAEKRQPWRTLLVDGNPAGLVEIDKIVAPEANDERTRVLTAQEIVELRHRFIDMEREYARAPAGTKYSVARPLKRESQIAVWICLGTLCRIGELLMAEWEHVDLAARTWFIPKQNVKGTWRKKQDHLVYLSDFALGEFTRLQAFTGTGKWCFPARAGDGHVDVKSVTKQIGDRQEQFKDRKPLARRTHDNSLVLADGKNGEWTPHDMRRTGATMMQPLGVALEVIDRCQNHVLKGSKVRRAYMQHDYASEKRHAWELLGSHLQSILKEGAVRLGEDP